MVTIDKMPEMSTDSQIDEGMKALLETSGEDRISIKESLEATLVNHVKNDYDLEHLSENENHGDKLSETCFRTAEIKIEHQDICVKTEPDLNEERPQLLDMIENGEFEDNCLNLQGNRDFVAMGNECTDQSNCFRSIKREILDEVENAELSGLVSDDIMRAIEQNFEEIDKMLLANTDTVNDFNLGSVGENVDMVELEQSVSGKKDPQTLVLSDVLNAVNQYEKTHISDIKTEETDDIATISEPETEPYCSDSDNESIDIEIDIDELNIADEFKDISLLKKYGIHDCYVVLKDIKKITSETKRLVVQKKCKNTGENIKKPKNNETKLSENTNIQNVKSKKKFTETEIPKKVKIQNVKKNNQKKYTETKVPKEVNVQKVKSCEQKSYNKTEIGQKVKLMKKVWQKKNLEMKIPKKELVGRHGTFQCKICSIEFGNIKSLQSHSKVHWNSNLICSICGPLYRYNTVEGLAKHLALHGKADFECSTCGKIFPNERKLKLHGNKHGIKPYKCDQCPKAYYTEKILDDHKRTHTNERPFKCSICNASFTSSSLLRNHSLCHSSYKYPCKICGKVFKRKEHLRSHMAFHSDARPYKCPLCDNTYKYKASLSLHNRSHTGEKVTCEICQKSFRDPGDLKKHLSVHSDIKQHKCDTCGLFFRQRNNLQSHIKYVHTDPSLIEKKFKCDKCGKCFEYHSGLTFHMKFHVEKTFECKQCTKTFKLKNWLESHIKRVHDKTGEKAECNKCGKTFTAVEGLRKHMKIHQYGRRYRCSQCGMAYAYSNHLKRHVDKTHNNVQSKRYKCEICGKEVVDIKSHLESHDKSKPFSCSSCGRRFRTKKMMELHSRVHWDNKPYHCNICDISFTRRGNWQSHMHKYQHKKLCRAEKEKTLKVKT